MRGAKRRGDPHPPSPNAPLCKGSCHGFAVTEGLPGVAGYFGDDLCSDSRPSLATAAHTLRCAPLARVVDAASLSPRKGRCPHRPVAKHHLWRFRRAGCDYTPPSCSAPPVGGGLRPAPLARSVFLPISVGSEYLPISRRGGPMCPPGHAFLRDPPTGRHAGRPLQILLQSSSTPKNRAGTETRPYSRRMPNAGSRSTGPSPPSSPASQNTWNDRRHQSLPLPSPVPTSPASAQRSARPFELPRTLRDSFQRKGRSPSFGRFKEGLGGKFEIPPRIFLRDRQGGFF